MQITHRYRCPKSSIAALGAIKGRWNATELELDGVTHAPLTLRFVGFAGALELRSGEYVGQLRWQKTPPAEEGETAEFNEIIGA